MFEVEPEATKYLTVVIVDVVVVTVAHLDANRAITSYLLGLLVPGRTDTEAMLRAVELLINIFADNHAPAEANFHAGNVLVALEEAVEGVPLAVKGIDREEGGREHGEEMRDNLVAFVSGHFGWGSCGGGSVGSPSVGSGSNNGGGGGNGGGSQTNVFLGPMVPGRKGTKYEWSEWRVDEDAFDDEDASDDEAAYEDEEAYEDQVAYGDQAAYHDGIDGDQAAYEDEDGSEGEDEEEEEEDGSEGEDEDEDSSEDFD
ncbi:hypothetical protein BC827DRAFT_1269327 [Russula dissimulans]|nr:hypothetical protein BC827DRAFT_1269327 [Russula dissimulans]